MKRAWAAARQNRLKGTPPPAATLFSDQFVFQPCAGRSWMSRCQLQPFAAPGWAWRVVPWREEIMELIWSS